MTRRNIFIHYRLPLTLTEKTNINSCILEKFKNNVLSAQPQYTTNELMNLTINKKEHMSNISIFEIPGSIYLHDNETIHMGLLSNYTPDNYQMLTEVNQKSISKELKEKRNVIPIFPVKFTEQDEKFGSRIQKLSQFKTYEKVYDDFDEEEAYYHNLKFCTFFAMEIQKELKENDRVFITSPELWMLPICLGAIQLTMCFYTPLIQPDIFFSFTKSTDILKSWLTCSSFEFQSTLDQEYFKEIMFRQICLNIRYQNISKMMFLNPLGTNDNYIRTLIERGPEMDINKLLYIPNEELTIIVNVVTMDNMEAAQDIMLIFNKLKKGKYMLVNCLLPVGNTFSQLESDNLTRSIEYFSLSNPYLRTIPITTNLLLYNLYMKGDILISLYNEKAISEFKRLTGRPVISSILSRIPNIPIHFTNIFFVNEKNIKQTTDIISHTMSLNSKVEPVKYLPGTAKYLKNATGYSDTSQNSITNNNIYKIPEDFDSNEFIRNYITTNMPINIYCDYDGTLTEIVPDPADAVPSKELLDLLNSLSEKVNFQLITGRPSSFISKHFKNAKYQIYTEHGAEVYDGNNSRLLVDNSDWIEEALIVANFFLKRTPGLKLEMKKSALTIHFRDCVEILEPQINELERTLKKFLYNHFVDIKKGKRIIDIVPRSVNKGFVIKKVPGITICIGDDITDEDMFEKCNLESNMFGILVGDRPSLAQWKVKNVKELILLLKTIERTLIAINSIPKSKKQEK